MKSVAIISGTTTALVIASLLMANDKTPPTANAVNGVKGVKQDAVQSVKNGEPPTVAPTAMPAPKGSSKVDVVDAVKGVKAPGKEAPTAVTTPKGGSKVDVVDTVKGVKAPGKEAPTSQTAPKGVHQVEGIEAVATNQVKAVPPPPVGAISTIQAVKGIQGIAAPKQLNLEAALLIKEDTKGNPAGAAAAAALSGPPGLAPGPQPGGDGRADFQEFEKLTTPGS